MIYTENFKMSLKDIGKQNKIKKGRLKLTVIEKVEEFKI